MNFKEKVRHMSKMGVPSSKIIEEKTPYVAKNLQKKFNKDTTAFVYVFGAKDAGRLGGSGKYYKDYKKNKNNLVGYEIFFELGKCFKMKILVMKILQISRIQKNPFFKL